MDGGTRVKVDHGALMAAEKQIRDIAKTMDGRLDTLRAMLDRMVWEGQDKVSYAAHKAQWDSAVAELNSLLNQIGGAVGLAQQNYATTELNNSQLWNNG
jgi:WXG100 family type VII secretion target